MCGLSGLIISNKSNLHSKKLLVDISDLLLLSQVRGQDAAGATFFSGNKSSTIKKSGQAKKLVSNSDFRKKFSELFNSQHKNFVFFGQTRLSTSDLDGGRSHNQPLVSEDSIVIHNGVITELAGQITYNVASEVSDSVRMHEFLDAKTREAKDPLVAVKELYTQMKGSATLAFLNLKNQKVIVATNTGSLYYVHSEAHNFICFSSEKYLLEKFLRKAKSINIGACKVAQLKPNSGMSLDLETCEIQTFALNTFAPANVNFTSLTESVPAAPIKKLVTLKRCSCCILPVTYPFIEFDSNGVCNFCHRYSRQRLRGHDELEKVLASVRSKDGSADCLVGLSGGRDSSYGLHLLKTQYGMNPVAYTFDWGLTTEVSRRNQARLCGQLGVEHIIRSADFLQKRKYIKNNVNAFLKRPHLGMVPLFMAGDKEFYQLGRTLRDQNRLPLTVFCSGHSLEQRDFMTGFCGVNEDISNNKRLYAFKLASKVKLALFYSSQYVKNPRYINSSLQDSLKSFLYSFIYRDDFLYLYEFIPWIENEMEEVLKGAYAWEPDKNYGSNQWRMGDGQTAFTNFIYYTVAGFSEYDNFRSNQVREGLISRAEALKLVEYDNQPKMEMLTYFADVVRLDLKSVMKDVELIPKLF